VDKGINPVTYTLAQFIMQKEALKWISKRGGLPKFHETTVDVLKE
jgi:hypothetical protein